MTRVQYPHCFATLCRSFTSSADSFPLGCFTVHRENNSFVKCIYLIFLLNCPFVTCFRVIESKYHDHRGFRTLLWMSNLGLRSPGCQPAEHDHVHCARRGNNQEHRPRPLPQPGIHPSREVTKLFTIEFEEGFWYIYIFLLCCIMTKVLIS